MFEPYSLIKVEYLQTSFRPKSEDERVAYAIFKKIGYEKRKNNQTSKMFLEIDMILPVNNFWNSENVPLFFKDAHLSLYDADSKELPFEEAPEFLKEILLSPAALTHECSGIRVFAKRLQNVT